MKISRLTLITINLAAATAVAVLAGCVSHGYDKSTATATSLKGSSAKIELAQAKLDQVSLSLSNLVKNPQSDLRPQYKAFSDNVDSLGVLARHVKDEVTAMRESGKAYFAKWDQEIAGIKNEDIRKRSVERKQEVVTALTDVKRSYSEVEMTFEPLMSDLRDIQKYLGTDLTPAGVASMKDTAGKVDRETVKLKESVNKLVSEFKALASSMSAVSEPAKP